MPHLLQYGGVRRMIEIGNILADRGHDITIYHSDGSPCGWLDCRTKVATLADLLTTEHEALVYVGDHADMYRQARAERKYFYILGIYLLKRKNLFDQVRLLSRGFGKYEYLRWDPTPRHLAYAFQDNKIVVSSWMKIWLELTYGQTAEVVNGGVNRSMFYPATVQRDTDSITVMTYGRQKMWKDAPTAEKAVHWASRRDQRICLVTFADKGIAQNEMAQSFSAADMFLNTELFGGWSNPTAEAMACGLPVISTDIGAVADFAVDGDNALLVQRKDYRAMGRVILRLANDPDLRERLARNGLKTINTFTWDRAADNLERVIAN